MGSTICLVQVGSCKSQAGIKTVRMELVTLLYDTFEAVANTENVSCFNRDWFGRAENYFQVSMTSKKPDE